MSWSDVLPVVNALIPAIDPDEDYMTLKRIEELMATKAETRGRELDGMRTQLRNLSQRLEAAKHSATRPTMMLSEADHARKLTEIDATKMGIAKAINDTEGQLASREAELKRLNEEEAILIDRDPATEHELDATLLKLQIFRGMGFEPVVDQQGNLKKIIVRSMKSKEVHTITFDDDKSDAEHREVLWNLATS